MKALLVHPGTQYSPALALALYRRGLLLRYATGLAFGDGYTGRWQQRRIAGLPDALIHRQPLPEALAMLLFRGWPQQQETIFYHRNRRIQDGIPDRLLQEATAVIGFDTSSWRLIPRVQQLGKPFVLDLSIPPTRMKEAVYARLRSEFPDWQEQAAPKKAALVALEEQELQQADLLVVASQFTASGLHQMGIASGKIAVNPYGTDLSFFTPAPPALSHQLGGVRFLFMGKISARKGIPWLLRVWPLLRKKHPHASLTLAGDGRFPAGYRLPEGVQYIGFVPAAQRAALLQAHEVFVFPSYFEGFGQVLLEAMACGLPVITTTHTVAPEWLERGGGWLLQPGDDAALLQAMDEAAGDADLRMRLGGEARSLAMPYSWDAYGERWARLLEGLHT